MAVQPARAKSGCCTAQPFWWLTVTNGCYTSQYHYIGQAVLEGDLIGGYGWLFEIDVISD